MKFRLNNKISAIAIIFSIFIILWVNHNFSYWEKKDGVINWDVISYYSYLPAFFVYHDLKLKFHKYEEENLYIMWPETLDNGNKLIKTTMGLSFMYMPFFLIAHGYSYLSGLPATGYTPVYKYFLVLSSIFYLLLGLIFLRKILLNYFDDKVTAITILVTLLGTNLYFFSIFKATMPHTYLFFLFSLFIWFTIKWYQHPKYKYAIFLGLTSGLITLIRPSDILIVLFFILFGISKFQDIPNRFSFFLKKWKQLILIFILAFIVFIPQFLYWKMITGHYIYYSYGDEHFIWNNPQITDGLFSYRKGWLIYTPVMSFALIGIFFLKKKLQQFFIPILIFTILNIYVVLSWWCWWYGGSFGQRAFIESYALLAIPLAMTIRIFINSKKRIIQFSFSGILLFFITLNIFNSYQYIHRAIHYDGTTKELYWKYFGKYKISETKEDFWDLIRVPDYELAKKGIYVDEKKKK